MKRPIRYVLVLCAALATSLAHAAPISYADGDVAPQGYPDGLITLADYLVTGRLAVGQSDATALELAHGDLYPPDAPDGVIDLHDLWLLQMRLLQGDDYFVENLDLFVDGPATFSVDAGSSSASTTVVVDGYTGGGATVINNPDFVDPDDASNRIWYVSISGGVANVYLGTEDLSADPVLDSGFNLSGDGNGQLIFDIQVNSVSAGAVLTVKIDSGYPALGQVVLDNAALTIGSWQRMVINFADLLADPGPGPGLDLANVVNAFVIEVTGGSADFYLDNIFVRHSCPEVDGCNATINTQPLPADADGDGVDDVNDLCLATPLGTVVGIDGCAIVVIDDADNDGVADADDLCPNTPSGNIVDADGCILVLSVNDVAAANGILVGGVDSSNPGFALYVFDNDLGAPGSNCNGGCATNWPPLLVGDGGASGLAGLGTVMRNDGSVQATFEGRPLYFFIGDAAPGETNGQGAGNVWWLVSYLESYDNLFGPATVLEPEVQVDTPTALITRFADRARDRHAREDQFKTYDHYLSFYWEHRTAAVEIIDTVGKGGSTITFNVTTQWPLNPIEAELRFFFRGIGTVAEYHNNGVMTRINDTNYTRTVTRNAKTNGPLRVGDRMEFELSQFLLGTPNGRDRYYGTAILYIVGEGIVPWEARGPLQDSYPMPQAGRLGGDTTLPYQYSDEPDDHFLQMSTNLSNINGQVFVLGRRVHHTDFGDGSHNEAEENADFTELSNLLGTNYVNRSCVSCHAKNGRALPPAIGQPLRQHVFKIGDASGNPDPTLGAVLQPLATSGVVEGGVSISSWSEEDGLRWPNYAFSGRAPTYFSARIAPQLVGMGLLEAITEADIAAGADPTDSNGDGISGRMHLVNDPETGQSRIGRFGWKASEATVKQQVAAALNTDIGVMTSVRPDPDCGASQFNCGDAGTELPDQQLEHLTAYISLLGVSARRDLADSAALQGEALFASSGCDSCHTPSYQTSSYHPHAELRNQTIYPYTDLLLHDMGPGLASTLSEGNAGRSEWRTPPLWSIGLTDGVSMGEAYLHDGRARNLTEAIRWHGGEGESAKQAFDALTQDEQAALIAFLKSL